MNISMNETALDDLAYAILSGTHPIFTADQIADLHSTRDAAELADLLINGMTLPDTLTDHSTDLLHSIMTDMILNPID